MLILFNWLAHWAWICRHKVKEAWIHRQARRSPSDFRRFVQLDEDSQRTFDELLQPWQRSDFAALDPAWMHLAGHHSKATRSRSGRATPAGLRLRAWIERPRGHSKTHDMAVQIAWILLYASEPLLGIAAAADREQAALLADALRRFARFNPGLCGSLVFHKHQVLNPENGSRLDILSSDVQSSWGQLPDFIICDELCHWDQPGMWHSLFSSAAKQPHCLLVVLTNAGVGRDWHWEAREAARENSRWHFSSLDGPHAPWITPEQLEEQRQLLPTPVYERLWLNRWQHSDGEFVCLAEAEACRDEGLTEQSCGQPGVQYFAAIDYAEKHDYTVAVLLHGANLQARVVDETRRGGTACALGKESHAVETAPVLIVDRLDVFVPTPDRPAPVAWVERWIRDVAARFHRVTFILDEYQLVGTIQALQDEFDVRRFPFRAGKGNHDLALNLRNLILARRIRWYPGCGEVGPEAATSVDWADVRSASRDDLETELASLLYRQSPSGLCRIDHRRGHHDDRAFALGAAALAAIQQSPSTDAFDVTPPGPDGGFDFG